MGIIKKYKNKNRFFSKLQIFLLINIVLFAKKKNKKNQKKIAKKRIKKLFELAYIKALEHNFKLSDRYVKLARKLSMKYLVKIPLEHKRSFCKHCYSYILPGVTGRVRIRDKKIVIYCYKCKKFTRVPIKKRI